MKFKKLLSLILSAGLLSPAFQPVFISAEENQTVSGDICTKNPEYEARKEAVAEAEKNLEAAGAEKDAAVKAQDQATKDLGTAQDAKAESEKKLDEANKALDEANKDVKNAEQALETVKSDAVQANTNLGDAKKAEQAAQKALDSATQAQKDAEQARDAAQTADDQAKADVENAEQAVEDAKAALEKARSQETASALGFFESLGTQDAQDAAELLKYFSNIDNYQNIKKYDPNGVTVLGGEKDATNLDFMLKAIQMMRIGNEKRAEAGTDPRNGAELSELKVSVVMWAQAMAYANMEAYTENHWSPDTDCVVQVGGGENLANGLIDHAYEGWYDEEKQLTISYRNIFMNILVQQKNKQNRQRKIPAWFLALDTVTDTIQRFFKAEQPQLASATRQTEKEVLQHSSSAAMHIFTMTELPGKHVLPTSTRLMKWKNFSQATRAPSMQRSLKLRKILTRSRKNSKLSWQRKKQLLLS